MDRIDLIEGLEKAVFRLYRSLRRETALKDLSPQDPVILKQIVRNPGIGVGELAALERLRAPTITSHVKRLEAAGMIQRVADDEDRRRSGLYITPKGKKAIDQATGIRHAYIAARLADLSPAELEGLEKAVGSLLKLGEDPDRPSSS